MRPDALRETLARARRPDDRLRPGRQREHRRVRSAARDRRRGRASDRTPGSTSTAPSGSGPPRCPALRDRDRGPRGADSWTTDAHKWLNVPYDSGIVVVRDAAAHHAAMTLGAAYYVETAGGERDPYNWVPESSRRARGFAVYAALRSLGRDGPRRPARALLRARPPDGRRPARRPRASRSSTTSSSTRSSSGSSRPAAADAAATDAFTRAVIAAVQARRDVLARRHDVARHGRDADLGLELEHDRGRRRSVRRGDPALRPDGGRVAPHARGGAIEHVSVGTAFHPRDRAAQPQAAVAGVGGYYASSVYADAHDIEYNAIREAAALIDVSPLYKYRSPGPTPLRLVDRVITRDATKLDAGPGLLHAVVRRARQGHRRRHGPPPRRRHVPLDRRRPAAPLAPP